MAMTSGRIAGEVIVKLHRTRAGYSADKLAEYRKRLQDSFVLKDLKKYKDIPAFLHGNKHVFGTYPRVISNAMQTWFRVDGHDKLAKERQILSMVRKNRNVTGLIGDAFRLARAWR